MEDVESRILELLKSHLKVNGMTYKDLAKAINLSEITIKKMFSRGGLDIKRLAQICEVLDIPMEDVVAGAPEPKARYQMTDEQDEYFYKNPLDYAFLALLITHETLPKLEKDLGIERSQSLKYVRRLEKLDLIELHPGDRIRFKVTAMLEAPPKGKLRKSQGAQTRTDFILGDFMEHPMSIMDMCLGEYTETSLMELKLEIKRLYERATHLAYRDSRAPAKDKIQFGILGAMRPWNWSFLENAKAQIRNAKA